MSVCASVGEDNVYSAEDVMDKDSGLLGCSLAAAESTTDPEFIHIVEVVKYLVDNVIESVRLNQLAPVRTYHIVCDEDDDSCSSLDTGLRYTDLDSCGDGDGKTVVGNADHTVPELTSHGSLQNINVCAGSGCSYECFDLLKQYELREANELLNELTITRQIEQAELNQQLELNLYEPTVNNSEITSDGGDLIVDATGLNYTGMQMPSNLWTWVPFGQIMNGKYTGMYVSKITGVQVYQSEGGVRETFDPREMFNQQAPVSNNKTPTKSVGTPSRRTSPRKPKRINYGETGDSDKYDIASEDDGQPAYVPDTEGIGLVHRRTGEPYSFSSALDQRVPRTRRRRFKQVDDLLPLDVMENGLFNTECVTLTEDEKAEFDKSEKNNSDGDNACEELDMTAVLMDMDENDLDNPVVCQPSPQFEVTVYIDSKTGKMRRAYTEETLKNVKRQCRANIFAYAQRHGCEEFFKDPDESETRPKHRTLNQSQWERNVNTKLRRLGLAHMNVHGDDIAALKPAKPKRQRTNRLFVEDNECCQALCDLNFTYEELENNLASAYDGSRYGRYRFARVTVQLMSWRQTKKGQKPVLRYSLSHSNGTREVVCASFYHASVHIGQRIVYAAVITNKLPSKTREVLLSPENLVRMETMKSFFEFISKEVPHLVRDNSNSEVKASRKLILRACFNSKNIGDIKALWKWYVSMCVENQVGHYQYDCFTRMFHDNGLQMHEYAHDLCERCVKFTGEKLAIHQQETHVARELKQWTLQHLYHHNNILHCQGDLMKTIQFPYGEFKDHVMSVKLKVQTLVLVDAYTKERFVAVWSNAICTRRTADVVASATVFLLSEMVKARQQAVERGERLQARAAKRLSKRSERLAQIDDVISNVASSSAPIRAAASANLNTASTSATYTHQPGEPSTATSGISSAPTIESTDAEDNAIRLIIYTTDGCISQNKNKTVSAAILEWLNDPSHTVTRLWHRVGVPGHPCVQNVDGAHSSIEGMLKKNWGHIKTMDQYVSALNSLNSNKTRWYVHKLQPEQIKAYTRAYYPLFKSLSAIQYLPARMLLFSANPAYIEETVSYVKLGSRRRVYVGFEDEDYKPTIQIINEEFNMSDWDRYDFTALVNRPKELNPYIGTALPIPDHYLGTLTDKQIIAFNKLMYCMTASEIGYWLDMFQTTYNRRGILAKSVPFDSIPSTELYERRPINLIFDGNVESAETELTALSPHPESLVVTTVDVENADILVEQDPELVYTDLGAVEDDVDGTIKCMGICNTCITTDLHLPNEIESAGTTTDESAAVFKKPAVRNLEDIVNKNFNQWTKPATNSATAILVARVNEKLRRDKEQELQRLKRLHAIAGPCDPEYRADCEICCQREATTDVTLTETENESFLGDSQHNQSALYESATEVSELHSFQESTAGSTCSSSTFSTSRASSRSRTERNPLTLATSAPSRELLKKSGTLNSRITKSRKRSAEATDASSPGEPTASSTPTSDDEPRRSKKKRQAPKSRRRASQPATKKASKRRSSAVIAAPSIGQQKKRKRNYDGVLKSVNKANRKTKR